MAVRLIATAKLLKNQGACAEVCGGVTVLAAVVGVLYCRGRYWPRDQYGRFKPWSRANPQLPFDPFDDAMEWIRELPDNTRAQSQPPSSPD